MKKTMMKRTIMGLPNRRVFQVFVVSLLCLLFPGVLMILGETPATAGLATSIPGDETGSHEDSLYLIGPGDVLEILVWNEPSVSRTVTVRLDGKISMPLVDDIQAAGITLPLLKKRITTALAGYVDEPSVYVMLQTSNSKMIYIVGKVNNPGEHLLQKDTTVLQAIAMAGGFTEWADKDDIVILRKTPTGQLRIAFNYSRVLSGKDIEQNILLKTDDVIVVP